MICHPRRIQLVSIVPPSGGHRESYMGITVTMRCADAHRIVRSEDGIHVMINYFTDFPLANSDDGLCLVSTLRSTCQTEIRVEESMIPSFNLITIPNHH
jgi:hypothetical protein